MQTHDLLLEIGVEEIPARFLPPAIKQIEQLAAAGLQEAGLPYQSLHVYATPRRLTLLVFGLAAAQADSIVESKGPALNSAYDDEGRPSRALEGFCRGHGLERQDLVKREIKGNIYLFAIKQKPGQKAAAVLPQLLLDLINKISFPKPMRWGYGEMRFARPIHWLVAMLDEQVLDLEVAGIKAANISRGHRVLGLAQIEIANPAAYLAALRDNYVICDQSERRQLVWQGIQELAANLGGMVAEDEDLLTEVVFLLEYPTAVGGSFAEEYLELPQELIITPMREHQRYFPVERPEGGLLPLFITVRNGDARFLDKVRAGNELVLRARLADAEFFWQEDLKTPLANLVNRLAEIVFHEKLGSMRQKVERVQKLAQLIAQHLGYSDAEIAQVERAAYLAKADLLTQAVYEFPELQGIMGEYYARFGGEEAMVATAIREHYQPRFAGDDTPNSKPGIALALADKIDTLRSFFALGIIPSGSQDPYALRRAASGCVQIIIKQGLHLDLEQLSKQALELVKVDIVAEVELDDASAAAFMNFMRQRVAHALTEEGLSYDIIQALENEQGGDLYQTVLKAQALSAYRNSADLNLLLAGFTRAANLVRSATQKGEQLAETAAVQANLLQEAAEKKLHQHLTSVSHSVAEACQTRQYQKALAQIAELSADIDAFFTDVMVMDKDEAVRHNRLALLQQIVKMAGQVGDLSKLQEV